MNLGSSITYRIAVGPQQGRKVFTLQTLPDCRPDNPFVDTVVKVAGFSLHAGGATRAHDRDQLERLCRYITRPSVSTKPLSLTRHGKVHYELKTPYSDGTTHILFEPLDFIARLAALDCRDAGGRAIQSLRSVFRDTGHNWQVAVSESGTCTRGLRIVEQQHLMFTASASNPRVRLSSTTNTQGLPLHRPTILPSQNSSIARPLALL